MNAKKPEKLLSGRIIFKKEKDLPYLVVSSAGTHSNKTGKWKSARPVIDRQKCIGCMLCWKFCPEPCIVPGDRPEVNLDYCKGCGICAEVCPVKAITMQRERR